MSAIAQMVKSCETIVDVGTDHGFLPIYLVQNKVCKSAIAVDVNQGPLDRAIRHIEQEQLEEFISTRLSDGFYAIQPKEAQAAIIAGMGGLLMETILEKGEGIVRHMKQLVLQPQSDFLSFRHFLYVNQYEIVAEDVVFEDGKYYHVFSVEPNSEIAEADFHRLKDEEKRYGTYLFEKPSSVFKQFLEYEKRICEQVNSQLLLAKDCEKTSERRKEVENKMKIIQSALKRI